MQNKSEAVHGLNEEIISTTDFIDTVVRSLGHRQRPARLSGTELPEAVGQPGHSDVDGENTTHRVLDMVEAVATNVGDILQELTMLKKALPATYFKNRSRVRGTFERMEMKAGESRKTAFSIMEVLQYRDITNQNTEQTKDLLKSLKAKLLAIREGLNEVGI